MNDFAVSGEAVARVHARVMGRIRRRRILRRAGMAAAIVAAAIVVGLWPAPVELEALALRMPEAPKAPVWVAPPPRVASMARPALAAAGRPAERIVLYTEDPDVVIVMVGDANGGEE
ncbi:MAG: hypothetical protein JNM66_27735 [Bryobacterales bacterium]|nr:hypothetical protein [Bryobacterales bacterium]